MTRFGVALLSLAPLAPFALAECTSDGAGLGTTCSVGPVLAFDAGLAPACEAPLVCAFGSCHEGCTSVGQCAAGYGCIVDQVPGAAPVGGCQLLAEKDCLANDAAACAPGLICAGAFGCRTPCETTGGSGALCVDGQLCALPVAGMSPICLAPSELVDVVPDAGGPPPPPVADAGPRHRHHDAGRQDGAVDGARDALEDAPLDATASDAPGVDSAPRDALSDVPPSDSAARDALVDAPSADAHDAAAHDAGSS